MKARSSAEMQFKVTLELTEQEARALHTLTLYGSKSFLEVFYKSLGSTDLKRHERGLIELFNTAQKELPSNFKKIDEAKAVFKIV